MVVVERSVDSREYTQVLAVDPGGGTVGRPPRRVRQTPPVRVDLRDLLESPSDVAGSA